MYGLKCRLINSVVWSVTSGTGSFNNVNALNPTFTPTSTGPITLQLKALNPEGCTADIVSNVTINVNPVPVLNIIAIENTTCNNSAGMVALSSGGLAGTVTLNGISKVSPSIFTGLTAGNYVATFRATGSGCSTSTNFEITNTNNDLSGLVSITDVSCNGAKGSAVVTATGGTTIGGSVLTSNGYQYKLDGGSMQASNTFTNLSVGSHTVIITDDNSCTYSVDFDIDQPVPLVLELASIRDVSCKGLADGTAIVQAAGGTTLYSYSIVSQPSGGAATIARNVISNMITGSYIIRVTDSHNCTSDLSVSISESLCGPVANMDYPTTLEDNALNGNLLTNDTDPNGLPLTVTRFIVGGVVYDSGKIATLSGIGTVEVSCKVWWIICSNTTRLALPCACRFYTLIITLAWKHYVD